MPMSVTIADASFQSFVDQPVPNIGLATGYWLMGVDQATSFQNLATNPAAESVAVTGTPIYGKNYVQVNVDNQVDTGITPVAASDYTYIAVSDFARVGAVCGTWHDSVNGHMLYNSGGKLTHATAGGSAYLSSNSFVPGAVHFAAVTRQSSGRASYLADSSGIVKTTATNIAGGLSNTFAFKPAGNGNTADKTYTLLAAAMLFPVALNDTQIASMYAYLKWKLARRGIVIL